MTAPEGAPRVLTGPFASRAEQHQLFEALDGWASVVPMWHLGLLPSTTRRLLPRAVIVPLDVPAGADLAAVVRRVRRASPDTPIVCCVALRPGLGTAICDVVRAGVTQLVWLGGATRRLRDELHAIVDPSSPSAEPPPDAAGMYSRSS